MTSFTATSRRSRASVARQTVPMPPLPMAERSSYRLSTTVPGVARSELGAFPPGWPADDCPRHAGTCVVTMATVSYDRTVAYEGTVSWQGTRSRRSCA